MKNNVKIAKQLIKIAKELTASTIPNALTYKAVVIEVKKILVELYEKYNHKFDNISELIKELNKNEKLIKQIINIVKKYGRAENMLIIDYNTKQLTGWQKFALMEYCEDELQFDCDWTFQSGSYSTGKNFAISYQNDTADIAVLFSQMFEKDCLIITRGTIIYGRRAGVKNNNNVCTMNQPIIR